MHKLRSLQACVQTDGGFQSGTDFRWRFQTEKSILIGQVMADGGG